MRTSENSRTKSRDLEKSRSEILNAAFPLVFAKGFQGVSVDDIVKQTTLTKGAFYHQFPTKMDLGYALVDEVIKPMIIDRWIKPLDGFQNPLQGILKQIETLIGGASPAQLKFGCPLNNLVQEMAPVDSGFKKRLKIALELWVSETSRHIERAQKAGQVQKSVDPREVAYFVVMAHEGFYGLLKGVGGDKKTFRALYRPLQIYFESISTKA